MDELYIRLVSVHTGVVERYPIKQTPAYVAISHTWTDNLFVQGIDFRATSGFNAVQGLVADKDYTSIEHCWIDTICIDQADPEDKKRQIPLIGQIYGDAELVAILVAGHLDISQPQIDEMLESVKGIVEMAESGTWSESGHIWSHDNRHRIRIKAAMDVLEVFTRHSWGMRVWTMQEFILARQIVWVDGQCQVLKIPPRLFQALPEACNMLAIEECLVEKYMRVFHHFQGMAAAHLGLIDQTRVMELLGKKTATIPEDEVIGLMSASGVELDANELGTTGKENVWALWWQKAVMLGHIRWALLPPSLSAITDQSNSKSNCIMPAYSVRHLSSANSGLDSIQPLGPSTVLDGTVTMTGRIAGQCNQIKKLGRIYVDQDDSVHRDISLILSSRNNWSLAQRLASAFGIGRYTRKLRTVVAQVLVFNYHRAQLAVLSGKMKTFRPRFRNLFQTRIWTDFMELQTSHMPVMNEGVAFLTKLSNAVTSTDTVIVTDGETPCPPLYALDFGAVNDSEKTMLTIVKPPPAWSETDLFSNSNLPGTPALHRVGVSTFLQVTEDPHDAVEYRSHILDPRNSLQQFRIGGEACHVCSVDTAPKTINPAKLTYVKRELGRSKEQLAMKMKQARLQMRLQNSALKLRWKRSKSRPRMPSSIRPFTRSKILRR